MEPKTNSQSKNEKPNPELRNVDDAYVLDAASGLYQPKPYASQNNIERPVHRGDENHPVFLNVNRDWISVALSIAALGVSIATLALLIKTVYWAKKQWEASDTTAIAAVCANLMGQQTLAISRRQLIDSERPWLKFRFGENDTADTETITVQLARNGPISIPSQFYNLGQTPARDVRIWVKLEIVPVGKDPGLPEKNQFLGSPGVGVDPPSGAKPIRILRDGQAMEESVIYPRSHTQFSVTRIKTITERVGKQVPVSEPEYDSIVKGEAYFAVWGQVWYHDIFGVQHWAKFCTMHGKGFEPQSKKCTEYADVDGNPEMKPDPQATASRNCPAGPVP